MSTPNLIKIGWGRIPYGSPDNFFHYVKIGKKSKIVKPYFQPKKFGKAVMMWGAISFNGKSKLYFVKPGIKINSEYYINNVLKSFVKEVKVLYPQNDFVFHQDCTITCIKKDN